MPKPQKGEKKGEYLSRCIRDLVGKEGYKQDQASAICYSYWRKSKRKGGESLLGADLFQDRVWALDPRKLDEINYFVLQRIAGETIDVDVFDTGRSGNRADDTYQVKDGVAIIPMYGVLSKKINVIQQMSGGTSTQLIKRDIAKALEDEEVNSILLDVDSPGGTVDGVKELADYIFEVREKADKPIVAYSSNMMASAAYWISSAADQIVVSDTSEIGSIGVAMVHYDLSKRDEMQGVARTNITAGKYKRIAADNQPLSDDGKAYLQDAVDTYYQIFLESVARNREVSIDETKKMADGRIFIGSKAVEIGLADKVGTMESAMILAKEMYTYTTENGTKVAVFETVEEKGDIKVTIEELREKHPELFKQVFDEGVSSVKVQMRDAIEALSQENKNLSTENIVLKKTITEQLEKTYEVEALSIWDTKLRASGIPEELFEKVKKQISHTTHVTEGVFNKDAFSAAVDIEIQSWEVPLAKSNVLGFGGPKKEVSKEPVDDTKEDEAWLAKMNSLAS
jgi:capsid assembly protease